jgi:hypothetical protein
MTRHPGFTLTSLAAAGLLALLPLAANAAVSVVGGLANFDVVNNTGREAYGFEIEFEDSSFYKSSVGSVFGLNRNFGGNLGTTGVVRFGTVDVSDYDDGAGNHLGVRITYGGNYASGIFTPQNTSGYQPPGESCWPGANADWTANPCDHYGVTTSSNPAITRYSWLVADPNKPAPASFADYTKVLAGIPAVNIAYTPPPQGQPAAPAQVQVQIQAIAPVPVADPVELEQPEVHDQWGEAFWVLTYKTKVDKRIDLGNLLQDNEDMQGIEVESEWSILQRRPLNKIGDGNGPGANEAKEKVDEVGDGDAGKAVMRRYEFYKYVGEVNPEDGEVICEGICENDPTGELFGGTNFVGDFVGAQMVGYNIEAVAAVPEPQTWALMLAGLATIGALARRRRG